METKFTKGKWILNKKSLTIVSDNDCSKNGGIDVIAQCYSGFNYDYFLEEAEANAKLIATAPELLQCLLEAIESMEMETNNVPEKWINAIKKATE